MQIKKFFTSIFILSLLLLFFSSNVAYASSITIDPNSLTFTPNVAKRISHGPFSVGVFVQGDPGNQDALTDDVVAYGRGILIGGNFYQTFDPSQGTIVLWWTPEFSSNSLSSGTHYIWYGSSTHYLAYDYGNDRYEIAMGGQTMTVSSSITAGTSYSLITRYDTKNVLVGSDYICFAIDDSNSCGATTTPTSSTPPMSFYLGGNNAAQAASGLIEGLTVYRRVLFDGAIGANLNHGDELTLIYNSGSGRDPTIVTGSSDVVVSVPFDSTVGSLTTGNGSAWTYPHADNLLDNGYLLHATPWNDWSQVGTPSGNGANSAANQLFDGGYYVTSNNTDEGYYQDVTVTGGTNLFARALVHADSNCSPRFELYDQTGAVSIGYIDGASNTTRNTSSELILTGLMPGVGSKTLRVLLTNTASSGTCYWHSAEVLPNSYLNPSYETGTTPSNVGTPTSSQQSSSQARTGSSSWEVVSNAADQGISRSISTTTDNFYSIAGYVYVGSGSIDLNQILQDGTTQIITTTVNNQWQPLQGIARASSSSISAQWLSNGSQTFYLDDLSFIPMANVSLTVTPASQGNSTGSTGLRIDGRDSAVQSVSSLGTSTGNIKFRYTPRHSSASMLAFQNDVSSNVFIGEWYRSANDTIQVYWSAANTITLRTVRNGTPSSTTYDATGAIIPNETYYFEIDYASGVLKLKIDGPTRASIPGLATFSQAPNQAYWGTDQTENFQADATFDTWEDPSLSFSIAAVSTNAVLNGITTNVASTVTSLPFGNITVGEPKYMAHQLSVITNASSGYTVTMNLHSTGIIQGLDPSNFIDPFAATGVTWSNPIAWTSPTGTVRNVNTGWLGANTTDTRVTGWSSGFQKFGPVSTTARPVMYSSGPDSGTTAHVTYALEVNVLQPTDAYAGQIVYTITPTY